MDEDILRQVGCMLTHYMDPQVLLYCIRIRISTTYVGSQLSVVAAGGVVSG